MTLQNGVGAAPNQSESPTPLAFCPLPFIGLVSLGNFDWTLPEDVIYIDIIRAWALPPRRGFGKEHRSEEEVSCKLSYTSPTKRSRKSAASAPFSRACLPRRSISPAPSVISSPAPI